MVAMEIQEVDSLATMQLVSAQPKPNFALSLVPINTVSGVIVIQPNQ